MVQRGEKELLVAEEVVGEVFTDISGKRSVHRLQLGSFGCNPEDFCITWYFVF